MEDKKFEIEVCSKCLSSFITKDPRKCGTCGHDEFEIRKGITPFVVYRDENGKINQAHQLRKPIIKERLDKLISEWNPPETDSDETYKKPEIVIDPVIIEVFEFLEMRDRLAENYREEVREQLRSIISDMENI